MEYLQENSILSDAQFDFRQNNYISDALFKVCKVVNSSIPGNNQTMLVFLDLKKTFDSIERCLFLKKLELIGIHGIALIWFKSYFLERFQVVSIFGVESDAKFID